MAIEQDLTTYLLAIDALDQVETRFTASHGVQLTLPRSIWEGMGCPANLSIAPRVFEVRTYSDVQESEGRKDNT